MTTEDNEQQTSGPDVAAGQGNAAAVAPTPPVATQSGPHREQVQARQRIAEVGALAAAVLLAAVGVIQLLEGVSAVQTDQLIVIGPQYTYQWNATGWGVVHIVIGALLVLVAVALLTGREWARVTAVVLATLSIVANFMWLPHNPWWSVLIIALDAYLIWALISWHHPPEEPGAHARHTAATSTDAPE